MFVFFSVNFPRQSKIFISLLLLSIFAGCGEDKPVESVAEVPASEGKTSVASEMATAESGEGETTKPASGNELPPLEMEKSELKFGFIKLTDCAPIVIAKETGFFEAEGLQVEVIAQPNWKQLLDNATLDENSAFAQFISAIGR